MIRRYNDVAAGRGGPCVVYVGSPELLCPCGVTRSILTS